MSPAVFVYKMKEDVVTVHDDGEVSVDPVDAAVIDKTFQKYIDQPQFLESMILLRQNFSKCSESSKKYRLLLHKFIFICVSLGCINSVVSSSTFRTRLHFNWPCSCRFAGTIKQRRCFKQNIDCWSWEDGCPFIWKDSCSPRYQHRTSNIHAPQNSGTSQTQNHTRVHQCKSKLFERIYGRVFYNINATTD